MTAGDTFALNKYARDSFQSTILYSIITLTSLIIQAFLLLFSIRISFRIKKTTSTISVLARYLYVISHVMVIVSIIYLLGEQLLSNMYQTILVELIVGVSLITSFFIIISLAITIFKSLLSKRSKIVILYGMAMIAIAVQLIFAFFYIQVSLSNKPEIITPDRNPWVSYFYKNLQSKLFSIYEVIESLSFIIVWIASIVLTKQYSHKLGKIKYWITVSIPLIYFLFQYSPLLLEQIGTLSYLLLSEGSLFYYFYNFVLNTVNVGTGILFGISFYILSRSIANNQLKYYLIVCATGIMILFSSGISTILTLAPYPAWAIVSLSFILPASFLLLIGLDSATYYIATDTLLRRFLYKHQEQFELFQALGSAKSTEMIEQKMNDMIRKQLNNLEIETMFKPILEIEDTKIYLSKVITEMKKSNSEFDNTQKNDFFDQPTE